MNLHIPTLFVMIMVVTATMALAIAVIARRRYRELMAWSVGLALQVVAYALYSLRGQIPDFWSIVVGNMAITGTLAMYAVGQLRFLGRPVSHWIVSLPIAVAFAGFYLLIHRFEERLLLSSSLLLAQNIFNIVRTYALTAARNCGFKCSLPGMKPVTKAATTWVNNSVFHW